jgi:hypothetical protein
VRVRAKHNAHRPAIVPALSLRAEKVRQVIADHRKELPMVTHGAEKGVPGRIHRIRALAVST